MTTISVKSMIRRDRWIVCFSLFSVTALAWFYLTLLAVDMNDMAATTKIRVVPWTAVDFGLMFVMWAVMMVGMMVPSATPMILMFTKINRNQRSNAEPFVHTGIFVAGYIAVWSAFSLAATMLQLGLQDAALVSPMMASANAIYSGLVLVAVGLYQWTPFKNACLRQCQTPLSFLMTRWRDGVGGAFSMGFSHGAYCVGCCWALMALLLVGGVMNFLWIAAISIFVLAEKITRVGLWVPRASGVVLIAWGIGTIIMAR
ncbi:MAG: DUF2182 domain-containing protein [Rhodospirillales bacterium]|jgi:predicted metal-binding membrane protein|nr:DUF2182 domain-containing protein [Rhodospirillales bacterium]MBT4626706.1 DUF2182 domain-containing protein [Rhodospirillales bacterium]MBT5353008.1 DUF2182 domain-containing protein [Rhodospirillales bacterium]MBT5519615.1 DUF2182 domain-containing protein [Rhodospirillales bacterium]MBT6110211.1 DUF2182 domain-containing protein [Rhodospirillales bacterium]